MASRKASTATAKGVAPKKGAQPKKTTLKRKDTRMKNLFGKNVTVSS